MTDSYENPLPSRGSIPPPPQEPLPRMDQTADGPQRRLTAGRGLTGFVIAVVATLLAAGVVAGLFELAGPGADSRGFIFLGTLVQYTVMLATAYFVTAELGKPSGETFGLRPFKRSAFKWSALAFVTYYALAILYAVLFNPREEELPKELGADEGLGLAIATGVLLIAVAPVVEEIFFRGFLYQSLRNSLGVWPGAVLSGLIFGAIHFEFFKLVQLAILGVILALLFERTRSLWPPIMLHALNNTLAYIYLMSG